jgi:hypothetical protein
MTSGDADARESTGEKPVTRDLSALRTVVFLAILLALGECNLAWEAAGDWPKCQKHWRDDNGSGRR